MDDGCAFTCSPPAPALKTHTRAHTIVHTRTHTTLPGYRREEDEDGRFRGYIKRKKTGEVGEPRGGEKKSIHPSIYLLQELRSAVREVLRAPHTPCAFQEEEERGGRTREEVVHPGRRRRRRRTMDGMQAYGAGKAGGAFDPVTFFQQPQTILRIVSWVSGRKKCTQ